MKVVLGDFAPDLDPVGVGIMGPKIPPGIQVPLTDTNWVYSTPAGWANIPMPTAYGAGLPSRAFGAFSALVGAIPFVVLATNNQLYIYNSGVLINSNLTLNNISNQWYFTLYGEDVIAVNGVDPDQVSTNGAKFVALGGSPPTFSIVEATDFSLFGVIPLSSQIYFTLNDTIWTPNISTQTGTLTLGSTPGNITAARQLRSGINIFKAGSFFNGQFSGPPFFWQFTKVSDRIGTPGPYSVITADTIQYFWGPDDFYATDGFSVWRVQNNVRNWFKANMNPSFASLIYGVYDLPRSQLVWWFSSASNMAGTYDSYISLSLLTGKWAHGSLSIDIPVTGQVGAVQDWTWQTFENTYGAWANLPTGLLWGSPLFNGSRASNIAFIDGNHRLNLINAPWAATIPAFITTGDLGDKWNVYRITRARGGFKSIPGVGALANSTQCTVFAAYTEGQPVQQLAGPAPISDAGFYDLVCSNRLQRLKIGWYADAELADLDVNFSFAGTQ